jgi:hypothetical protein
MPTSSYCQRGKLGRLGIFANFLYKGINCGQFLIFLVQPIQSNIPGISILPCHHFWLLLFNMGYEITLNGPDGDQSFECADDVYILYATEEAGMDLPY